MAVKLAQAYVEIVPSMKGVGDAIKEAVGEAVEKAGKPAGSKLGEGISTGLGTKLGAVAGVASNVAGRVIDAFRGLTGEITSASDSAQKFASTLSFAGVSDKQIKALTQSTQDYADKTVYDLNDIRNTTAQLASNGVSDYARLAEAAGNLNAVAGGSSETFKSVALMLTQTAGAGKLTTENWNQLADAIPGASGKLQEAMLKNGAYTGNFRDAMEKGEITADEFNQAIMQLGMTDVAKEAATSTTTIEGSLGNLEAAAVKAGMTVLDSVKPMVTTAMNGVSDAITAATPGIQTAIQETIEWFGDLYKQLQDNGALETFKSVWESLVDVIEKVSGIVVDWMKSLPPATAANAIKAVADALKWFSDNGAFVQSAAVGIGAGFAAIKVGGLASQIIGVATGIGQVIRAAQAATSIQTLSTALSTLAKTNSVAAVAQRLLNAAMNANPIMIVITLIAALVAGLVYFFTQTEEGKQAWQNLTDFIQSCVQSIKDFIQACKDKFNDFKQSCNDAGQAIQDKWNQVMDFFRSIPDRIRSAFGDAGSWLRNAGAQIIQGLKDGITGRIQDAVDAATAGARRIVSAVKGFLGIHSPSRVFRDQVGVMIGRGMALGLDDSASFVSKSMDSLVSSMSLGELDTLKTGRTNMTADDGMGYGNTYVTQTFNYPAIAPTSISTQQKLQTAAMPQW